MDWDRLEGSLREMSGKIKQHWGRLLTDNATSS